MTVGGLISAKDWQCLPGKAICSALGVVIEDPRLVCSCLRESFNPKCSAGWL